MPITNEAITEVAETLYRTSLMKVPDDTQEALRKAIETESNPTARDILSRMLDNAAGCQSTCSVLCGDSGIPAYSIKVGTKTNIEADVKAAVKAGFDKFNDSMVILPHVASPFTLVPYYEGQDVPLISYELMPGADYVEITCAPKGLGTGRWEHVQVFSFPTVAEIEKYIFDYAASCVAQMCPPAVIGVGIGGAIDYAAKMAKDAIVRHIGTPNPDPFLNEMEQKMLTALNKTGIGPIGTGGDTSVLAVHIKYAAGHGFVPVAIAFNCWPNRRQSARIYENGKIEYFE